MTLDNLLNYRRAVRRYSKTNLVDTEKVKKCIDLKTIDARNVKVYGINAFGKYKIESKTTDDCITFTKSIIYSSYIMQIIV